MKHVKLKTAVICLVAVLLTFFTQPSLAYYTTIGRATNVVTTGEIRFIIHETTDQGTPFPEEGVYIVPGDIVSKQVFIESACQQPFYLRVKLVYGVDEQELSSEECFRVNINEAYWQLVDGWYYYKGVVEPGQTTPYVFSQVEIVGSEVDNAYLGKTLTLSVIAQGVQSAHNPVSGTNTYEASGWPAEGGTT
ncbi:MAG: hypothetical protein J6J43_00175 [Oscillospiraceae bacterium]|nr:hypothetical protein [Oscillospiraceae bacterium]